MIKERELLKYRQNIKDRFNKLENFINNDWVSTNKAKNLRTNYNIQLHLIDFILGKRELSNLLLKEIERKDK